MKRRMDREGKGEGSAGVQRDDLGQDGWDLSLAGMV